MRKVFKYLAKVMLVSLTVIWAIGLIPLGGPMWAPAMIKLITKI